MSSHDADFLSRLPKVELHAHLNGCIRESTLVELAKERNISLSPKHFSSSSPLSSEDEHHHTMYNVRPRSLQDCFDMFADISQAVNDLKALERITREALDDFQQSNVIYLELRTTPKILLYDYKDGLLLKKATKKEYVDVVLRVMQEHMQQYPSMTCRLILAVDRSLSVQEATENIDLAIATITANSSQSLLVGVDLGGNPTRNDFRDYQHLFQKARQANLKVSLHCAEVPCEHGERWEEAKAMLQFRPNRLGHALLLPKDLQQLLLDYNIPVETCPTSNVMTLELHKLANGNLIHGLGQHVLLKEWLDANHPLAICTDDPGVFDTNASKELIIFQQAMELSVEQVATIVLRSMDAAFCDCQVKQHFQRTIQAAIADGLINK